MCLVTLPPKSANANNDNQESRIVSATSDNNIAWKTIYLTANAADNVAKVNALTADDKYVRCVLTADVTHVGQHLFFSQCEYAILDLNGHAIKMDNCHIDFRCRRGEVTDSSVAGTGAIYALNNGIQTRLGFPVASYGACETLIFSGGNLVVGRLMQRGAAYSATFIISGGNYYNSAGIFGKEGLLTVSIAPYMNVSKDATGTITQITPPTYQLTFDMPHAAVDDYDNARWAVSRSEQFVGAYNYVYGYAWELTTMEVATIKITQPGTYYLWCRSDTGWYTYTGLTTAVA